MVFLPDVPRNRTLLITGLALLVLAACCLAAAVFGLDTHGTGQRITYGVIGAVLVVAALGVLVLQRAPQSTPLAVSPRGLLIPLGTGAVALPWSSLSAVRIERSAAAVGGYQLIAELRADAPIPSRLQHLLDPRGGGAVPTRLVIGLGAVSPDRLAAELGAVAPPGLF